MKRMLLSLTGIMFCTAALHSAAAKAFDELHAAVTDIPDVIDMSHADPKTWHRLPPAGRVYDVVPTSRAELTTRSSANGRG
jgi:hypothetical protein